jgi:outer membrane protein
MVIMRREDDVFKAHISLFSLLLFVLSLMGIGGSMAQTKIGYVDSEKILSSYPAALDAQKKLEAENTKWDQELRKLNDSFHALQGQLDQQSLLLSDAKKKEKQQELEAAAKKIQEFQEEKWGEGGAFFKRRAEIMQPVIDKINQVIHRIGEEEDYDYILDAVAGNILHAKDKYDITELVLEELQKETSSSTSTPRRD